MNQNGVYGSQGIESPNNTPGARTSAIIWTDSVGNAYLFGGLGFGGSSSSGYLNDVWCLSISSLSWKWLKGSSDINQIGIYGSIGIESMNNTPGGRSEPASWTDSYGNAYLFGGLGFGSSSPGSLNDVWFLNISSLSWKWLKGSSDINQLGIYGSIGIESVSTIPGGREGAASWTDLHRNPYLFGGRGYGSSTSSIGSLNDLWYLNISSLSWKWLKGSSDINQNGIYGSIGIESIYNIPGGRSHAVLWTDADGNAYLHGGRGYGSSSSSASRLNDVWFLNMSSLTWKWLQGSSDLDEIGIYGSIGIESMNNIKHCIEVLLVCATTEHLSVFSYRLNY
jgi:N-acetylneuraminic acid mutarotase